MDGQNRKNKFSRSEDIFVCSISVHPTLPYYLCPRNIYLKISICQLAAQTNLINNLTRQTFDHDLFLGNEKNYKVSF